MAYTLGEAAKATGKSKATISKAIKTGRVSAIKHDDGSYSIEPAELHRVYPFTPLHNGAPEQQETQKDTPVNPELSAKVRELEAVLNATQQRLSDRDEVIADLREDRDRWRQQAQSLLTDQRPRRKSWWPWTK